MQKYKIEVDKLNVNFGNKHVIKDVSMKIRANFITAVVGPPGCGKSYFLGALNRMNELEKENVRVNGKVLLDGEDIYHESVDVSELRRRVGMVFRRPDPFPKSIYENIAFGPRIHGCTNKLFLDDIVEKSLREVGLWKSVKKKLFKSALSLPEGQQQLLCIGRLLAVQPEVLLMNEPTAGLDPVYALEIEGLIQELKKKYTIVYVTTNMQQAARISDNTAFFLFGELVEFNNTATIFTSPKDKRTEDYISGRYG